LDASVNHIRPAFVTTIRPNVFPQPQPQPSLGGQREEAGRLAAQRAFFAAAMGQTQAPAAVAAPVVPPAPAPVNRVAEAPAEAPRKVLRPGSLLDIRV
jgi:hypothetical protein